MILSIALAVSQFKQNWTNLISEERIQELCRELGYSWRERLLEPGKTFQLFMLQILHGNTALSCVPHLAQMSFSSSALCQAKQRLPLEVLETLLKRVSGCIEEEEFGNGDWYGHRVFLADGSGFSMPDTSELQQHFPQSKNQKPGCGFPTAKLLGLFHCDTGMISEVAQASLASHDMHHLPQIHSALTPGDILLGDRAFCSFAHFALLSQDDMHAVMRVHQSRIVRFQSAPGAPRTRSKGYHNAPGADWLEKLGEKDQVVRWHKPYARPQWMDKAEYEQLPNSMLVRELEFEIKQKGFRTQKVLIATTLLDAKVYTKEKIAELYHKRWQVEINFRHLKTTMKMDVMHSKTYDGIRKELIVFCLLYNLVWLVIRNAAQAKELHPQDISFIDALRWLCFAPGIRPIEQILAINHRPNRVEPREIKRRGKAFKFLTKPRAIRKEELMNSVTCTLT